MRRKGNCAVERCAGSQVTQALHNRAIQKTLVPPNKVGGGVGGWVGG
jgi:hypothetical protein